MRHMKGDFVTTRRGRFHVRDTGGDGQPVVMLHGWPEDGYCWQHVAHHLDPRWRVIAPDLLGLGDSERNPDQDRYRKQELAQDVVSVLDEMGIGDFFLVGHDWGGVVAQEVAVAIPERVGKLVIMNIALINNLKGNMEVIENLRQKSSFFIWYQHFQQTELPGKLIPGNESAWLGYFLRAWGGEFPADSMQEYIRMYSIPGTPDTAANYYRTMGEDAKRWATLAGHKYPMPALYIYGNQDVVITPDYLNHHEACFEQVRVAEIEAGHFLQEEKPEQVAREMNAFFAE